MTRILFISLLALCFGCQTTTPIVVTAEGHLPVYKAYVIKDKNYVDSYGVVMSDELAKYIQQNGLDNCNACHKPKITKLIKTSIYQDEGRFFWKAQTDITPEKESSND